MAQPDTQASQLFYFPILVMNSGKKGPISSQDISPFFIVWELELIPIYLLLSMWGENKCLYSATKFIFYTVESSIFY